MIRRFSDLLAWQAAHALTLLVYRLTKLFPKDELFGLTSQSRRAVVSVAANIAEGFGRNTRKDKLNFYAIAHASLDELQSHMLIARDLGYMGAAEYEQFAHDSDRVAQLVTGLMRSASDRA